MHFFGFCLLWRFMLFLRRINYRSKKPNGYSLKGGNW
jgi:hypothetical protein